MPGEPPQGKVSPAAKNTFVHGRERTPKKQKMSKEPTTKNPTAEKPTVLLTNTKPSKVRPVIMSSVFVQVSRTARKVHRLKLIELQENQVTWAAVAGASSGLTFADLLRKAAPELAVDEEVTATVYPNNGFRLLGSLDVELHHHVGSVASRYPYIHFNLGSLSQP